VTEIFPFLYRWVVRLVLAGDPLITVAEDYTLILNLVSKHLGLRRKMMQEPVKVEIVDDKENLEVP
jgi:hypothetical protein